MKVIVNVPGFYGGDWKDAGPKEVEMVDKVARQFLPPRGDQLSIPKAPTKRVAAPAADPKKDD